MLQPVPQEFRKEKRQLQARRADLLAIGFQNSNEENQASGSGWAAWVEWRNLKIFQQMQIRRFVVLAAKWQKLRVSSDFSKPVPLVFVVYAVRSTVPRSDINRYHR